MKQIVKWTRSDEYRRKIHDLIPGGAHTYSKGDDQFPTLAPAAIEKGLGSHVWDVDGNEYLDCSMGLTSVSLGHAYEPVLEAVRRELLKGVNFQRPAAIELAMAEAFLSLVPQHQMIKFAKNGSTATTAAVKLARAFTGREIVAFPGDHPFFSYDDWFIGRTTCDKGVPDLSKQLTRTYMSSDLGTLEDLFAANAGKIACVISEPERTVPQPVNYLSKLIEICHRHGALFIQDEMITGFKTDFPGSMSKLRVVPDLATWGKGIANGFSFCALTGKKEVMEVGGIRRAGQDKVFLISTTHGGETHSMAAALATIREFETKDVLQHNHKIGDSMIESVRQILKDENLSDFVEISPTNWMQTFVFKNRNREADPGFRTLFMQEMIRRGILFQGAFVPCYSHAKTDVELFCQAFSESCEVYSRALEEGWKKYLTGEPSKPVFRKIL